MQMSELTSYAKNKNQVLMLVRREFDIPYYKVSLEKVRGVWHWSGHVSFYFNRTSTGASDVASWTLGQWVESFKQNFENALFQHELTRDEFLSEMVGAN